MTDTLIICHDYYTGTTVEGTSKNSPAHHALRAHPYWVWSNTADAWLLLSSRNRRPQLVSITTTERELTRLGYTVERDIDDTMPDVAIQQAHIDQNIQARADHLRSRAETTARRAQATSDAADRYFPDNHQPLLQGHHSCRADSARRNRGHALTEKAADLRAYADALTHRADSAAHHLARRADPTVIGNRIQRLETQQRAVQRDLDATTSAEHAEHLAGDLTYLTEQITYWKDTYAQLQAEGKATILGPDTVKPGDVVKTIIGWLPVRRVNQKSVTVPNINFPSPPPGQKEETTTVAWHKLLGHHTAEALQKARDATKQATMDSSRADNPAG